MVRLCGVCKRRPRQKHWNSKWCQPCAKERKKHPVSTLSNRQIAWVEARIGTMPVIEMADRLGTSVANVKRAFRGRSLWFKNGKYVNQPELVRQVCDYYAKHGKRKTIERFPRIKVRSIVERFEHQPRQVRWKPSQVIELARMAGLISFSSQAKHFARPNANIGSIKSAWMKKFHMGGSVVNGLSHHIGRHFVKRSCPIVVTRYWATRRERKDFSRKLYLWTDIEKHLRPDAPEILKIAAPALAEFQRRLHGTSRVRARVKSMIKEIES